MPRLDVSPDRVQAILEWCDGVDATRQLSARACEVELDGLAARGWRVQTLGFSQRGTPIRCAVFGPGQPAWSMVVYGYPHPDEPTGATTTIALAHALERQGPPPCLEDVAFYLLPCLDPDQATVNEGWIEALSLDSYVRGHWRPIYQGLEVDYAFPIDHGPLFQPANWAPAGWTKPLPESLALAGLFRRVRPRLVGTMHANNASGVYSFLSHRPSRELVAAFDESTTRYGLRPHLGERPDPGGRWVRARPDLLKERRLTERIRDLKKLVGEPGERRYLGCVSAGMYLESLNPEAVMLTPEVGLWDLEHIADQGAVTETRTVRISVEATRRGLREIWRGEMLMPDGAQRTVCYAIRMTSATSPMPARTQTVTLTRGMAGVEAVERRRFWLAQADELWATWQAGVDKASHRRRERLAINVPAHRVNDRSMLIFRTASQYEQTATAAQAQDLRVRWALQDCLWLSHGVQLYAEQGLEEATLGAQALLDRALADLPALETIPVGAQVRSQAARLLLCATAVA